MTTANNPENQKNMAAQGSGQISQYALVSKRLPATRYFGTFSGARAHAKALGLSTRQYKIVTVL